MKNTILATFVGLSALGLTACGSSGSSDSAVVTNPPPPVQVAPSACGVLKANEQCLQINNRHFMLISPAAKTTPSPIVLAFYGSPPSYGTPQELDSFLGLHALADSKNYLIALPLGGQDWTWESNVQEGSNPSADTALSLAIIDKLVNEHQGDNNKVATVGFSAGAMMSYQLACQVPHRVKAAFAVSGQLRGSLPACKPSVPVVLHHLHGTADTDMALEGRVALSGNVINSLSGTLERFRQINGCSTNTIVSDAFKLTAKDQTAKTTSFQGCIKPTQFTMVEGGQHHPEYLKPVLHQLLTTSFTSGF
ncbi:alpha/beta hydrolase family esterase [Rheinheimera riviphila]|nr:hypothetical protein [Rheinheimera riviphila]